MRKTIIALALGCLSSFAFADMGTAASLGDIPSIKKEIEAGASIDSLDRNGFTPLQMAAWHGQTKLVIALLEMGANPNSSNARGETAIMTAAWQGHDDIVRILLDKGASVDNADMKWNALHYASFAGHQKVATTLLTAGANVNLRTTNGSTALMMTAREHHPDIAKILIASGAKSDFKNDWGDDAMAWALKNRNLDIAKIIDEKADIAELERLAMNTSPVQKSVVYIGGTPASPEMIAMMEDALRNGRTSLNVMPPKQTVTGPLVTRTGKKAPVSLVSRTGTRQIIEFATPAQAGNLL